MVEATNYSLNTISKMPEKIKVLLVDDKTIILDPLSGLLEKMGYESLTAEDGQEGLDKTKEHNPDVVLLDYGMPVMNGGQCAEAIKAYNPEIKIVGTGSIKVENDPDWKVYLNNIDHIIIKPFDIKKVIKGIEKVLAGC